MRLVGAPQRSGASRALVAFLIQFAGSFAHRNDLFGTGRKRVPNASALKPGPVDGPGSPRIDSTRRSHDCAARFVPASRS